MSTQLDILALEPYYGGVRRVMLDSLSRASRHRWTIMKLPARRMERRLSAAAHWFAEILSRHAVGHFDLLFVSEAINLADLYRLMPELVRKPAVVYFHSNQLPDLSATTEMPLDLVNLNTATSATEIWFNSIFHLRNFLARATALVRRLPELSGRNPMPDMTAKARIMHPPIDLSSVRDLLDGQEAARQRRTLLVETTDADIDLLNNTIAILQRRSERFRLITIGSAKNVEADGPIFEISERDTNAQLQAMLQAGAYVSVKIGAPCDHHAIRAMTAGCWPIFPDYGVYPELVPDSIKPACLYEPASDMLASRLQDFWHLDMPTGYQGQLQQVLRAYEPIVACLAMDARLHKLAMAPSTRR